jgi:short-subunit dehydrogenase
MKPAAIITGGVNGLGRELAAALAATYSVCLVDVDTIVGPKVAHKLGVKFYPCDITQVSQVKATVAQIAFDHQHLSLLVNSAGIYLQGSLTANSPDSIVKVIEVNTLGTINLCRFVIPFFKKQKSGTIINIVSQAALYPKARRSVYHASKWAVRGFTKSLQAEVSPEGIKVVALYPALMKTKFLQHSGFNRDMSTALDPEIVVQTIQFILSLPKHVLIPELSIRHLMHV